MFPVGKMQTPNAIITIGFLVFPGFPMACLTSMIEPLRAANEIAGCRAFAWKILSETGAKVTSSAQVVFEPDAALGKTEGLDYLFLLSSPSANFADRKTAEADLRRMVRHGMAIGGVSGGVFPLARSGVMQGHALSVHWCYEAAFAAEFPDLQMRDDVIWFDPPRYTVAGAAAGFDLMLSFIEDRFGADIATEVACWFQHPVLRGKGVRQKTPTLHRDSTADMLPAPVAKAVQILTQHLADPIAVEFVAQRVGVSPRQLERQFKKATGQSPSRYYRMLRMKAARQLVLYSQEPVAKIAASVGYETAPPLLRHYREEFGLTPAEDRAKINRFRMDGRPSP